MTTIESILTRLTKAVSGTDKELYTEEELTKFAIFLMISYVLSVNSREAYSKECTAASQPESTYNNQF